MVYNMTAMKHMWEGQNSPLTVQEYQNLYSSKEDSNKVDPATYDQFVSTVYHKLTQEESDSIESY